MKTSGRQINWEIAKQRVAGVQAELSGSMHVDAARLTQVFRQRAQRLAQRRQRETVQVARTPVLTFRAGNERFGLELAHVAQVFPRLSITPFPGAANHLLGVANLQGKVRSIIDLGRLMGGAPCSSAGGYVVLMRAGDASVGLFVESVEEVCRLELDKLSAIEKPSPERFSGLIKGTTNDCISVLNPDGIMSHIRQKRTIAAPSSKV